MINKKKNICYVIHVNYMVGGTEKKQKFVSQYGSGTKKFKKFRDDYFKNTLKLSVDSIGGKDGDLSTQMTISNEMWKLQKWKDYVLEGITEKEKCY